MNKFILLVLIIAITVFTQCKKDTKIYHISGTITGVNSSDKINGVKVSLDAKKLSDGVYNPTFVNLKESYTDNNGKYSMEINEEQVSEYRFRIYKEKYFEEEEIVSVENLQASETFTKNFSMMKEAWIELKVKNTSPQGTDDKIVYRFTNIKVSGIDCCGNQAITGIGAEYNATTTCKVQSDEWIQLEWVVYKNGGQIVHNDSLFTEPGQTIIYSLNY
jgi:hypothetical protein